MYKNKVKILLVTAAILAVGAVSAAKFLWTKPSNELVKEIVPVIGSIRNFISTTGTVLPKNRLEVKPPVNGRIESISVKEGDKVEAGQVLAAMSSTERAALIDAARGQGEVSLKYWEQIYKPIPLPAPISGEVIVAKIQPGQTVTIADAAIVLSDQLIIRAQVDETDIGKVASGMRAYVRLDAYPETQIKAVAEHIYYESKTVNNVTIYEVDLKPEEVPVFFRSGMNAAVDFIVQEKENILMIPIEAVYQKKQQAYCLVKQNNGAEPLKAQLKLGVSDDKNIEVISGISEQDRVIVRSKKYSLPKSKTGNNPFVMGH